MNTGGPFKARCRAFWHTLRRPGHRIAEYYIGRHLVALHCLDCRRAFYGPPVIITQKESDQ